MSIQNYTNSTIQHQFEIHKVGLAQPFLWLARGWQDLWQRPWVSIAYGLMVTMMGVVILLFASTHIYLIAAAISGFLLAGPFMSTGLCELSRQHEHGQSVGFDDSLNVLASKITPIKHFSATLLIISILWFILSSLALFAVFGDASPSINASVWSSFLEIVSLQQVLLYLVVGGILACIVFALSVVSIPAIIDSDVTALDAMLLSVQVVAQNFFAMIIWASLIFVLTAIGFISYLLGMIVIFPLLGHATWHAYRDLVEIKVEPTDVL
ncbi:MAG: DUF2189 domain-containing protein [Methylophaga sp.]|nr:DUF2189 domain-containing protein [Methylophaga sp.]